jgi:hypothetical protein
MDVGIEMCIPYHTKDRCCKDCGQAKGHSALKDGEVERLYKFIDENVAVIVGGTCKFL